MIRFRATAEDGSTVIGLGITDGNIDRLRQGRPIWVEGGSVGVPGVKVVIYWGRDEYDATEQVSALLGPDTQIVHGLRPEHLPPDRR